MLTLCFTSQIYPPHMHVIVFPRVQICLHNRSAGGFFCLFFSFWKSVCNHLWTSDEMYGGCSKFRLFFQTWQHEDHREKYDCRDSCLRACKDTKHPNNCFIRNMEASLMETDQMTWFKLLLVLSSQVIFFQWAGSWILHRNKSVFSFAAFFSGGVCCT